MLAGVLMTQAREITEQVRDIVDSEEVREQPAANAIWPEVVGEQVGEEPVAPQSPSESEAEVEQEVAMDVDSPLDVESCVGHTELAADLADGKEMMEERADNVPVSWRSAEEDA